MPSGRGIVLNIDRGRLAQSSPGLPRQRQLQNRNPAVRNLAAGRRIDEDLSEEELERRRRILRSRDRQRETEAIPRESRDETQVLDEVIPPSTRDVDENQNLIDRGVAFRPEEQEDVSEEGASGDQLFIG